MANQFNRKILEDGWRNAVVYITGILDTSDMDLSPAIAVTDFTNNDVRAGRLFAFRVDEIEYSIGDGLQITVEWEGPSDELIAAIAGRGKLDWRRSGGLIPNTAFPNYTGGIDMVTTGFNIQAVPPQNFALTLKLIKLYSPT